MCLLGCSQREFMTTSQGRGLPGGNQEHLLAHVSESLNFPPKKNMSLRGKIGHQIAEPRAQN